MVYWHDDTGAAMAGKHKSDVCSEISRIRKLHTQRNHFNDCEDLRKREQHSLCLAHVLQRQKGMKATMMKTKATGTAQTMR